MTSQGLGHSLETVYFWCFSIILDLQLPLDSQLHVSFLVHSRLRICSLMIGASRLNSGNFDRISLPNIKKNGATPVVIWGVNLCQLKICEVLFVDLFLQFELPGSLSTKCGFDILPPHSLGETEGELFGVLLRFPQGRL